MSRPFSSRSSSGPSVRINGKIRAREVRVIDPEGKQLGILPLADAIVRARNLGMDLVEVAPNANPPVCRIVDFGKYQYEQAKKEKESRKHQHSNRVKEIQLRPVIDPHDFGVKLDKAVDFLCDDMKVKLTLRFRGREMRHQELGEQIVAKFIQDVAPYGQPIESPRVVGRGISVMINPLPRARRARHPRGESPSPVPPPAGARPKREEERKSPPAAEPTPGAGGGFINNPFARLTTAAENRESSTSPPAPAAPA